LNFKLELPEDTILINRTELKEVLQEMFLEMKGEHKKDEIMTIREAADFLKVSIPTIRNMIAAKEIPFFQRGQVIRLNRWDVKEWMRYNSKQ
jgi:excisionase family DNA binding protein